MTNPNSENLLLIAVIIIGIAVLFIAIVEGVVLLQRFTRDLTRINREISRSTDDDKYYWLKKRRRLWLSLIPFVPYKCY